MTEKAAAAPEPVAVAIVSSDDNDSVYATVQWLLNPMPGGSLLYEHPFDTSERVAELEEQARHDNLSMAILRQRVALLEGLLREAMPLFLAGYITDAVLDDDLPEPMRAHLERRRNLFERIRAALEGK